MRAVGVDPVGEAHVLLGGPGGMSPIKVFNLSLLRVVLRPSETVLGWASLSKPHTSNENGKTFICLYVCIVCMFWYLF